MSETTNAARIGLGRGVGRGLAFAVVVLAAVYAYLASVAGGADLVRTFASANPWLLTLPFIATLLSYVTMSLSYEGIARAAGCQISSLDMLRITFVANTANYVLPTGGISGFALRMVMLNKKGVPSGRAVLVSFTQTILTNFMLVAFIAWGLVHLMLSGELPGAAVAALVVVVSGLLVFLGACLYLVRRREARARFLAWAHDTMLRLFERFGRRARYEQQLRDFFLHVEEGMQFFAARPRAMVAPLFWIFLDWLFTVAVLYTACRAVGADVSYGDAIVAFAVAIVVAVASFVPGGVGVLEVTLAGMFASVGVPDEQSVLAIFVFRVAFYVAPVLLTLVIARGAFRQVESAIVEPALR